MPHGHSVDNWSLKFYRNGIKLDPGESRSPTQDIQWNLLLVSDRLWAYEYLFGADSDDGEGDDGDVGDYDGVSDGCYGTRRT
jgi:hypothetical protein